MKEMNLTSTEDFVKYLNSLTSSELKKAFPNRFGTVTPSMSADENTKTLLANDAILWKMCVNHMQLMKIDMKRKHFYPCDDEGNILKEPLDWKNPNSPLYNPQTCEEYKKAKEQVLFEWFELDKTIELMIGKRIGYMVGKLDIKLTQAGINYLIR